MSPAKCGRRDRIVASEAETGGQPRRLHLAPGRVMLYARTPELVSALADIQRLRTTLRDQHLPAEREADLWEALTTAAIYHTNHLEGNALTFEEARAIITEHRRPGTGSEAEVTP